MIKCYVIPNDNGFAPNYDGPALTLACCKPKIRKTAKVGDWIAGTRGGKLRFAAKVSEATDFDSYFRDPRFAIKRPTSSWNGDAIYLRENGKFRQIRNRHHSLANLATDTSADRVLICEEWWRFPSNVELPGTVAVRIVKRGQGHRNCEDPEIQAEFEAFLSAHPAHFRMEMSENEVSSCAARCEPRKMKHRCS